jgi:hypothetical protein
MFPPLTIFSTPSYLIITSSDWRRKNMPKSVEKEFLLKGKTKGSTRRGFLPVLN